MKDKLLGQARNRPGRGKLLCGSLQVPARFQRWMMKIIRSISSAGLRVFIWKWRNEIQLPPLTVCRKAFSVAFERHLVTPDDCLGIDDGSSSHDWEMLFRSCPMPKCHSQVKQVYSNSISKAMQRAPSASELVPLFIGRSSFGCIRKRFVLVIRNKSSTDK